MGEAGEHSRASGANRWSVLAGVLGILLGLGIFLYPDLAARQQRYRGNREGIFAGQVSETDGNADDGDGVVTVGDDALTVGDDVLTVGDNRVTDMDDTQTVGSEYEDTGLSANEAAWPRSLQQAAEAYNQSLFESGQADFRDASSLTQVPGILADRKDEVFGYLDIPAMDLTLPVYIGADDSHMAKGAAVLGGTSLPVGGENTNCVIAGHRGYRGMPYFREIEKLSVGDPVYVTNPWEQLCYRVISIDIIDPDDSDKVKIRPGQDMLTLVTCHPYRSHGKYRYVVYCLRDTSFISGTAEDTSGTGAAENSGGEILASDGTVYASSEGEIQREKYLRRGCAAGILWMLAETLRRKIGEKGKIRRTGKG